MIVWNQVCNQSQNKFLLNHTITETICKGHFVALGC